MKDAITPTEIAAAHNSLESSLSGAPAWQSDNGDGTFTNPPLYADYPDPDIIRVGEDFYFATTTFVNAPCLRLLHSKDLVNWEIISQVFPRLEGREEYSLHNGGAYRSGIFAPSLRHHDGMFYMAVTPVGQSTRICRATDPRGSWELTELNCSAFDPALFFEDDGAGYIASATCADGTVTLLTLDAEYSRVVAEQEIHYIKGCEGCKIIKRGGWYYLFNAVPRDLALTVSRAKNIFGPYETVNQIDDTTGGHQGAIVDLPDGNWYGFVMVDAGAIGRMTNISPIFWKNDWPVWGTPDAPGKVPATARKPIQNQPMTQPATSDDFNSPTLGLQWAWNHNPDNARWSLHERPGFLRLKPTQATEFWTARNTLTQKGQGPRSRGEVKFDLQNLRPGDACGFGTLGKFNGHIAVHCNENGNLFLSMSVIEDTANGLTTETRVAFEPIEFEEAKEIFLRTDMDFQTDAALCSYSLDGENWTALGGEFPLAFDWRTGTFQGQQYAIFCYNPNPSAGFVDVDGFRLSGNQ